MNYSPDLIGHFYIFVCVFFLCLGTVRLLPDLFGVYRERYQSKTRETSRELSKFFISVKPTQIFIGAAVLALLLGFVTQSWVVAAAIMAAGIVAPRILLNLWKDIRSAQFEAQLMDALLLIANSLRSGLDIVAGIERVVEGMKPPVSEEFGLVLNAYRLGTPLEEALNELTLRINSRALETVVYAINIQRESGGNVIRIFEQLITTIREESKLQRKARAITSQARSQIFFLAGFPWALALLFVFMAPDLMGPALNNTWGQIIVIFLIIWEVIGILITKKIVSIEV